MKRLLLLIVLILIQIQSSFSCSCAGEGSFCQVNFDNPTWHVFIGKIIRHDSLYTEFEIFEKLRGVEQKDTIKIWDNPALMNTCIGSYEKESSNLGSLGDSILVALPSIDSLDSLSYYATVGDHFKPLNVCSKPYLPIKNQQIIGNLTETDFNTFPPTLYRTDSVHIDSFKIKYHTQGRAHDCDLFVGLKEIEAQHNLIVSPNPFQHTISINSRVKIRSANIFNILGEQVYSTLNPQQNKLELEALDSGVYFMVIESFEGEIFTNKLIKN